jgi:hypothetical protein
MTQDEKDKLLALFERETRWCQHVEAQDDRGKPVHYCDKEAVAWDVVGGMCFLFGWERACKLFGPVARHVSGLQRYLTYGDWEMAAMASLQDFNDQGDTTYALLLARLRDVPVHRRG